MSALAAGLRVGPYTVVSLLGKGGMGEVYRAHDERLGRDVAVKVLPASMASDPEALARFEREARAVAALNHPGIVALHDVGTQDGTAYVVTELLEGETLRERLDRDGPLPPRRALTIAAQAAQGIGAAHARGVIHRDVKPENLFLLADGRVKVLDFGIARQIPADPALHETVMTTRPGIVMGTFGYVSPEVVRGEPATASSDIFAFGLVVYELLTGVNPFRRATVAETVSAVLRDEPPSLLQVVPSLSPAAARLVHRCLEPRPDDRPDSLRDVAQHLNSLVDDSVTAPASGDPSPASTARADLTTVRQWALGALLAGSVGLAALLLAALWLVPPAVTQPGGGGLGRVPRIVAQVQRARLDHLQLTATMAASSTEIKPLFGTNAATMRESLIEFRRTTNTPLVVALDLAGRVFASTDDAVIGVGADTEPLRSLQGTPGGAVVYIGDQPYAAASAAAAAGGEIFGLIVTAAPLDGSFAHDLADASEGEVALLDGGGARGATLRPDAMPWTSLADWRAQGGGTDGTTRVMVGTQAYAAREVPLDSRLSAIVMRPQDGSASPLGTLRTGIVLSTLLVVAVGAALVWWLAGRRGLAPQRS